MNYQTVIPDLNINWLVSQQTKRQKKYDWRGGGGGGTINQAASPAASLPPRHCL